MKIYITAQALQKHEIETRLAVHMSDIIEHLLKLYLMPKNNARNHWQSEIYSFLHSMEKLKQSKKYPSKEQIYSWTYDKVQDLVTDKKWLSKIVADICNEYSIELLVNIDTIMKEFDSICTSYFTWISEQLSMDGYVNSRDVYNKLDSLMSSE